MCCCFDSCVCVCVTIIQFFSILLKSSSVTTSCDEVASNVGVSRSASPDKLLSISLQEIVRCTASDVRLATTRRRIELEECVLERVVQFEDTSLIAAAVAVVWRGEDGHDLLVMRPVVAFHHELMRAGDELQVIRVVKRFTNVLAERVAGTSRRYAPAATIVRIGPQQITHGPFVRHLLYSIERANMVERVDRRRQAAVQTEYLALDERGERQIVEQVREELPDVCVAVLAKALVVETVHLCYLSALVVAAYQSNTIWVTDL